MQGQSPTVSAPEVWAAVPEAWEAPAVSAWVRDQATETALRALVVCLP